MKKHTSHTHTHTHIYIYQKSSMYVKWSQDHGIWTEKDTSKPHDISQSTFPLASVSLC